MQVAQFLKPRLKALHDTSADPGGVESSVMVLLTIAPDSGREEILLTKRTNHVETHKGQISFPGGLRDRTDADLLQTALRESYEEIGAPREKVEVLGALPKVMTRGNVYIFPWVGVLREREGFVVNDKEVERILFLPVETLLIEGLKNVEISIEGMHLRSIGISVDSELVWGATARILQDLRDYLVGYVPKNP